MGQMKMMPGDWAKDLVTGYEGVVVARTEWLTGCATVALQAQMGADGKVPEIQWVDEIRLQLMDRAPLELCVEPDDEPTAPSGGPHETPKQYPKLPVPKHT
jgi:hypothetical protein